MRCRFLLPLSLLLTAIVPASAESPTNVVRRLIAAIRNGDPGAIAAFYVTLDSRRIAPDSLVDGDDDFMSPTWRLDSKEDGNAAVVIVATLKKTGLLDIDPCYLVREDGKWLVLPERTDIRVARGSGSEATMKSLETVNDWFRTRKRQVYEEIFDEVEQAKPPPQNAEEAGAALAKVLTKRDPQGFPEPRRRK